MWSFTFLHKGSPWQPVLSLKYRMSAGRARAKSTRAPTEHYSYLLVNTEFVFLFVFIIILIEI